MRLMQNIFLIMILVSGFSFSQNIMVVHDTSGSAKDTVTIRLSITNDSVFVAFQTDIELPPGLTYIPNSAKLSNRKADHTVSASVVSGNKLRIIAFSLSQSPFTGNSGDIITFRLKLPATPGGFGLTLQNPIISGRFSNNVLTGSVNGNVTVKGPEINLSPTGLDFGRVPLNSPGYRSFIIQNSGNMVLNISRIYSGSVNFKVMGDTVLSLQPFESRQVSIQFPATKKGAFSDKINIQSNDPDEPLLFISVDAVAFAVNELHLINASGRSGFPVKIDLKINNMEAFAGFQFDLILPEPCTYIPGSVVLSERKGDHTVLANLISGNRLRVVAFSATNSNFSGNDGNVVSLGFLLEGSGGVYPISLDSVIVTDISGANIVSSSYSGTVSIISPDISGIPVLEMGEVVNTDTLFADYSFSNIGSDTLIISSIASPDAAFINTTPLPLKIPQGQSSFVRIRFHNINRGLYQTRFLVRSNDSNDDPFYFTAKAVSFVPNYIALKDTIVFSGDTARVALNIQNAEVVVAFQVDVKLPDSIYFIQGGFEKTGRLSDHTVNINSIGNNTIRIFAFSLNQSAIPGSDGPVGYFKFKTGGVTGPKLIQLADGILSDRKSQNVLKGTIDGNLTVYPRPQPPLLTFPANKAADIFLPVQFTWQNSLNANSHQFQLFADSLMQNKLKDTVIESGLTIGMPLIQYSTKYFWRVRGKNDGGFGEWSALFSFVTVIEKPAVPILASPMNNAVGLVPPVTFKWFKSIRATRYLYEISSTEAFDQVFSEGVLLDTVWVYNSIAVPLQPNTRYYWRVKAYNIGGYSDWSPGWSFKMLGSPYASTPVQPANQVVNQPLNGLTFKWTKAKERIETIQWYQIQISSDSLFATTLVNDSTLTDTTATVGGMSYLTRYFWRVRAKNETGWGDWSERWQFTTIIEKPAVPVLASPQNNALGLVAPVTFKWRKSLRATKYVIQISRTEAFDQVFLSGESFDTTVTYSTSFVTLAPNTRYYWRIKAQNIGGDSEWSTGWNFKMLGSPYAPTPIQPVDQAVDQPLNGLVLKWSKAQERIEAIQKYQLQVSTDSLFATTFITDSTFTDTSRIVNGMNYLTKYFWRVRAKNETGWGDWSAVWRFTTIVEKPPVPLLASPVNNAVGQLAPVTLKWFKSDRATRYHYELSRTEAFDQVFSAGNLFDTLKVYNSTLVPLQPNTRYYWRIKAYNVGGYSDWSPGWSFKMLGNPYASTLLQPVDQSVNQPLDGVTFKWTRANERIETIQKYQFQVSTDSLFGTLFINDTTLTDTSRVVNGMSYLTKYFWRVRAQNETGWGDWSNVWRLTTIIEKPTIPQLAAPLNNAVGLINPVTARWSKSLRAEKYHLQVSVDSSFTSLIVNDSTVTDTSAVLPDLSSHTQHFWRLKAINVGGISDWSTVWTFKTLGNPYASNLIQPIDNSIKLPVSGLVFKWTNANERIETIQKYQLQVSADSLFGSFFINDSTLTDTTATVGGMNFSTLYFWRVRAKNETGWGDWSGTWRFTTIIEKPAVPELTTPVNGSLGLFNPVSVHWRNTLRAESYSLQVAYDSLFVSVIIDQYNLVDTVKALPILVSYTKYYWRVKAHNAGGTSDWSTVWNFKTLGTPYSVQLASPPNGAINHPVNSVTFKWYRPQERLETIQKYHFQLAYDSLFTNIAYYDSTYLFDTATTGSGLSFLATYYWRVRAKNQTGWGDWSAVWHLTTIIEKPVVPQLASPANNSTKQLQPVTLRWRPALRASIYTLEVSEDPAFGTLFISDSTITDTLRILPQLDVPKTYYWRVKARNIGGVSEFSEVWNFRTLGLPLTVNLVSPLNGAMDLPVNNVSFTWSKGGEQTFGAVSSNGEPKEAKATGLSKRSGGTAGRSSGINSPNSLTGNPETIGKYWLEITTDTSSSTIFVSDSTLTDTTRQVSGFAHLTTYYWRVKAQNEVGWGNFTVWSGFTTIIERPGVTLLVSPQDQSTGNVQPITVKWRTAPRAEKYTLEVSDSPGFTSFIVRDTNLTDTMRVLPSLLPLQEYYWRVYSVNTGGISDTSAVWKFKTLGAPTTVNLVYPADNVLNIPVDLTFTWTRATDQEAILGYWFELATDTTATPVIKDTLLTDTLKAVNQLANNTSYFWRVKAKNETGWGNFTDWGRFKTVKRLIAPPSNLAATAVAIGQVRLEWSDNSDNELGFVIARKTGDSTSLDPLVILDTVSASVTQYLDTLVSDTTLYSYLVVGYNNDTISLPSNYAQVFTLTGINELFTDQLPKNFDLYQNYPNPFNPSTMIRFAIPRESRVRIELYSMQGELISVLMSEEITAGYYETRLEIPNYASGIYLYRIIAQPIDGSEPFTNTKKLILIK